jgi:transcriptional regulator with XRE-family HTH domain
MAKLLSEKGIAPMHATTIAKIEAGSRSVRINEAVGIADLLDVSLDSLLGRKPGAKRSEVTYRLRVLGDAAQESYRQVAAMVETLREQSEELTSDLDTAADDDMQKVANDLQKRVYKALRDLDTASKELLELARVSHQVWANRTLTETLAQGLPPIHGLEEVLGREAQS